MMLQMQSLSWHVVTFSSCVATSDAVAQACPLTVGDDAAKRSPEATSIGTNWRGQTATGEKKVRSPNVPLTRVSNAKSPKAERHMETLYKGRLCKN